MIQTVEAVIDADGHVRLLGEVRVDAPRRALVTVLEEPAAVADEAALLAESALAADWSRPEEDAAWSHLQRVKSSWSLYLSRTCRSRRSGRLSVLPMLAVGIGFSVKSPVARTATQRRWYWTHRTSHLAGCW